MRFYRTLTPIAAMTFDLDDTLYDNVPVMDKTEKETLDFIRQYDLRFNHFTEKDVNAYKKPLLESNPDIFHDITQWRWLAARNMLLDYGYSEAKAQQGADEIMAHFAYWRSHINVPKNTHQVLTELAQKIPLIAITNGNANPLSCGLGQYFSHILKAGPDGRSKPYPDMFDKASSLLNLPHEKILHVGDHLVTDVEGAVNSGLQACWINLDNRSLFEEGETRVMPHIEITDLSKLVELV
ncbi:5-amino-6-(5-phospho-D-ribitylamino)uracil phosphatase YigB [Proteus columbae]|uniref:5-amino-6-(5-phospho-D-ribitylamino)uracil phosphatase YigB n=1 Tax=Proteus columbae TaxID=1987580 RepID=UPI0028892F18|nr:5-amino-6-(5-phospho-D-ribitylamino)uracil phosphatase YigB [Proteus columbae]